MKNYHHYWLKIAVCCFVCLFITNNTRAQKTGPVQTQILRSAYNGKSYELTILLPQNYSATDTVHYPVLYLLDGKYSFPLFQSLRAMMDLGNEIRDLIIVGIEAVGESKEDWLASRHEDFTPSHQPKADSLWTRIMKMPEGKLRSGGAEKFLQALQFEMIPQIEQQYKTSGERGLYGHSLGGLFASYCLLKAPALFNRYSINSPSLWWNANEMLQLENESTASINRIKARVFISAGSYEGEMMLAPVREFTKFLSNNHPQSLDMRLRIFEEESHLSVTASCSSKTLKVLYPVNDNR